MRKIIGTIVKVLAKIWSTMVILCAIALLFLRFGTIPFGYEPIWCMSNSMAPTFHEGALCYIDKNYDVNTIEVGDIIAYELSNGAFVTHRVHELTDNGIITKGDANANVDFAPISKEQIVGENVVQIENLGNLFKDFPNMLLIYTVVFAIAVMLILDTLSDMLLKKEEDENKGTEENAEVNTADSSVDD
jgi:signal peptidase